MSFLDDRRGLLCVCLLAIFLSNMQDASAREVWLMTYGTGDLVEERFGHNALWLRDPANNIDQIYNFGFFDFDQPNFYQNYLLGRMMYFAVARNPADELGFYEWRDRNVLAQRLNLSDVQIDRLGSWLEVRVSPQNREFRYDYFFNNCSNRVRDGLDYALDGWLKQATDSMPADQNFREHTRRLIQVSPLLYLAIHTGLGRAVDQPRSVWEAMFLPEIVAQQLRDLQITASDGSQQPLVIEERVLYASSRVMPPERAQTNGLLFALLGIATAALIMLPIMLKPVSGWSLLPFRGWLVLSACSGFMLLFLWLFTEHQAAWRNENLLLLNPLLIGLWRARFGRIAVICAGLICAGLILSVALKLFDGAQWNYDLMLWWLPAQMTALYAWYRASQARSISSNRA